MRILLALGLLAGCGEAAGSNNFAASNAADGVLITNEVGADVDVAVRNEIGAPVHPTARTPAPADYSNLIRSMENDRMKARVDELEARSGY